MTIIDSSYNRFDNTLLIHWTGLEHYDYKLVEDYVDAYVKDNQKYEISEVERPSEFRGLQNPGRIVVEITNQ